jgi:hypothetical protein
MHTRFLFSKIFIEESKHIQSCNSSFIRLTRKVPVPCYGHLKFLMKIKTIFKASCKTIKTCYDKVQQIQMEKQHTRQLDWTCTHNLTLTCSKCTCYYSSSSSDPSRWKHIWSNKVASHHIYFHRMPKKATMKKNLQVAHMQNSLVYTYKL